VGGSGGRVPCRKKWGDAVPTPRPRPTTPLFRKCSLAQQQQQQQCLQSFIEQAFDALQDAGFHMVGACGSGTNSSGEAKPGSDSEENRWNHYNEFAFCRR